MDANRWLRIKQAFDALLDLGPAEQREQLQALGVGDPVLRDDVESLLAADAMASTRLAPLDRALSPASKLPDPFGFAGQSIAHFRVLEPLGAGGMGIVYRAEDSTLRRPVALKFLLPAYDNDERAKERLLREARAVAALDHPNLCTVLEVGETTNGDLFIAMVLYQGETLKDRLEALGALSVPEAVGIARQLSLGLAHAHNSGIIHGDLKPGNIMLLPDGTAKILDFGLARARDESTITASAYRGTVPYMAPEQMNGRPLDPRTDLWSLGVILYEMLTGGKPFTGSNDARIAEAILSTEPLRISHNRTDVPLDIVELTDCLLAKEPSKRFNSAADLEKELKHAASLLSGAESAVRRSHRIPPRALKPRQAVLATAFCGLVIGAAGTISSGGMARFEDSAKQVWSSVVGSGDSRRLDDHLILVPPFRVTSNDSSVQLLRAGIMDLVSAKLTGSIRVVDARAVLNEWHAFAGRATSEVERSARLAIARHFGAGKLLDGAIVETTPGNLEITGSLDDVSHPGRLVSVRARGSRQNIGALVDTLVAKLIATSYAGLDESAASLAETPFDALQAYLSGQFAFRNGEYLAAAHAFQRALQVDSTFALAAVRLDLAAAYTDPRLGAGAMEIARAHREKLGVVERLILETEPTQGGLERFAVQQRAIQTAPEVPEFWYNLGENLAHWGLSMGFEDAQQRAIAAFERALALDSTFTPARHHLLFCYSLLGDTAGIHRVLSKLDARSEQLSGNLWLALGRRADLATFLKDSPRHRVSPWLSTASLMLGRLDDLEWAAHYMDSTAATRADRSYAAGFAHWLALDRGQPDRARRVLENIAIDIPPGPAGHELDPMMFTAGGALLEVMLWSADSSEAAPALARMNVVLDQPRSFRSPRQYDSWIMEVFAAAEYGLVHGQLDLAQRAILRLNAKGAGDSALRRRARHAALLIDAQLSAIQGRPDATSLATVADSVLRRADTASDFFDSAGSLLIARVWERLGDLARARAATARISILAPFYSSYLSEHARLSALAGDREGAISDYRRYIMLRSNSERSELANVESAKRELSRLLADSTSERGRTSR